MKKNLITQITALAITAALALPSTVCAAPSQTAPIEMSVAQDGKSHKVFVFGTSLALVSTDGSIQVSSMGPVGRIDVMVDGNLTKNVSSIGIPAGQQTVMALDKDSVVAENVSPESDEAVKQQISEVYAAGAASVDLSAFSVPNVTAYKVNEDGTLTNAAGSTAAPSATGLTVSSMEAASAAFTEEIHEIAAIEAAEAAEAAYLEATAEAASTEETHGTTVSKATGEAPVQEAKISDGSSSNNSAAETTTDFEENQVVHSNIARAEVTITFPERVEEKPEYIEIHDCNCGWSTTDYDELKQHMYNHAIKGEAYSYTTVVKK